MYEVMGFILYLPFVALWLHIIAANFSFGDDWHSPFNVFSAMIMGIMLAIIWPITLALTGMYGLAKLISIGIGYVADGKISFRTYTFRKIKKDANV